MFKGKIAKIKKRDGRIVDFSRDKIINAIKKAASEVNESININEITDIIEKHLFDLSKGKIPNVELVQDLVEEALINKGYAKVARAYILYRQNRKELRELKKYYGVKDDLKLSVNSIRVLQKRYLLRDNNGKIIETPLDMFRRVAIVVSKADNKYYEDSKKTEEEFFEIMSKLEFIPNSPTLMNAGTRLNQLSACFVLQIEDSLEKIFDTLKITALIQKTGGGTGFSFSRLRSKGSILSTTKGVSSGPVSFMSIFDKTTDVIKQGSKRRGANMGILSVHHPDIQEFISCKEEDEFSNFNISVSVTDDFMKAVLKNKNYYIIDPKSKKKIKEINARMIFESITNQAWKTGDPGLIFIDEINRYNPLEERIESTNPCGEQPLLVNESCVLGSINLNKFVKDRKIQWENLRLVVRSAVHFLDNVIDVNYYITKEIEEKTKSNRKIGLGIMGWADMLIRLGIKYDTNEALKLADKLMKFIKKEADQMSVELGLKRGSFPNFRISNLSKKFKALRNCTRITIAPTGTISLIANESSSGIEPIFAISYIREVLEGTKLIETNQLFEEIAKKEKFYTKELMYEISKCGSIQKLIIPKSIKRLFVTALDINYEWHVKMQAIFQKYSDNGVSKTINMKSNATQEEIKKAYLLAYKLKCKGITVFRYGSKEKQVLYFDHINVGSEFSGGCPGMECAD